MVIFPTFFFRHYRPGKCVYDILEPNNTFLGYKNEKFKNLKNWHFSMLLVQKWPFFQLFFFRQYRRGKCLLRYSRTKKHLGYKNTKFKKSKDWLFSKRVIPFFWSKNGHFSNTFLRQYRPGKCVLRYSRTKKHLSRL